MGGLNLVKSFLHNLKESFGTLKPETTLYYPGCMTQSFLKEVFENYKALLHDLNIDFITIKDLKCCGSPLLNAGYRDGFDEIKEFNLRLIKKSKITKIITNCPHCYEIFKNEYGFNTEHITQTLFSNKHKLSADNLGEITYHDPCLLSRKNKIIREPRGVLKQSGFTIIEPFRTKEKTFCCGAGGGVKQNSPKIANKIAKERLTQLDAKKVVVSCPYCYAHLKDNADSKKKIVELSETLVD